jgi:hypothetical protein
MIEVMQSLLSRASPDRVRTEPYPHIVIEDALDRDLAARLREQYPMRVLQEEIASNADTRRFNLRGWDALQHSAVTPLWKEFLRYHSSTEFFREIVALFRDAMAVHYPTRTFDQLKVGLRKRETFADADVLLDAQAGFNTPSRTPRSVRKAHIDEPQKVFAGLYYLRREEDDSEGGDFLVYRPRAGRAGRFRLYNDVYVDPRDCEVDTVVPYRHNVFVLFLNTPQSWHGVSVRSVTEHPRIFANLLGELDAPLFDLRRHQSRFDRLLQRLNLRHYDRSGYTD